MPTVPILLFGITQFNYSPGDEGDRFYFGSYPDYPSLCLSLNEGANLRHGLLAHADDSDGGSVSSARTLIPLPYNSGYRVEKGTLSIPDGPQRSAGVERILRYKAPPGYLDGRCVWSGSPQAKENINVSRAWINTITQISVDGFRLESQWIYDSTNYDGSLYTQGWTSLEIKVGAATTIHEGIPTGQNYGIQGTGNYLDQDGASHVIANNAVWVKTEIDFETTFETILVRLRSPYGEYSNWVTLKVVPQGALEFNEDENQVSAAPSFGVTSPIINYRFEYVHPGTNESVIQDSANPVLDLSALVPDYFGTSLMVYLTLTSAQGCTSDFNQQVKIGSEESFLFGSFVDRFGVLYSAVNDGQNVRVSRFKSGAASRQILASIPNAKNPALALDRARNTQFLSCEDRANGAQKLLKSTNGGKVFQ